ncbi:MAG: AMP-binding protein [Campylobacterota bacterium]|nr:AMP-binding protein [Campylobacterota bacterium]
MKSDQKEDRLKSQEEILIKLIYDLCLELHSGHNFVEQITLDNTFDKDLGLDSLARVELISRVEAEFKIVLPEQTFVQAQTPRDLFRAVQGSHSDYMEISSVKHQFVEILKISDTPSEVQTLVEMLKWHLSKNPDRPHIQFYQDDGKGDVITYKELYDNAVIVASSLQQYGLKMGDSVAIMLPTSKGYFFSFFGILIAGGIPVPIYPPSRPSQLEEHIIRHTRILENCQAQILITVPQAVSIAYLLKSHVPSLDNIVSILELLTSSKKVVSPVLSGDDIAFIQYTSGSTGDPKGVTLTHANLLANIRGMGKAVKANSKDVFVSWLPLYHDMGLIGAWLGSLYFGALYVVMSPLSFLARPQRWLWAIHRYNGTLSASPNFGYEYCMHRVKQNDFKGLNLSSWRAAFNGAEAVSPKTITDFSNYFEQFGFNKKAMMPVYGLAESSVGVTFPALNRGVLIDNIKRDIFMETGKAVQIQKDDSHPLHFVSSGIPLSGHQIRIVDFSSREMPERQEGRLQFYGPSSTNGYFRNAQKTEQLFDGKWLNTGDLAYIAKGELYITGRIKDIIIRAGRNIYPDELEKAIGDIEGIRKGCVAIFGSTDTKTATERLIVLAETRIKDPDEKRKLRLKINELSTNLIGTPLDDVILAPPGTVLKTSSGKIRRDASRQMYEKNQIGKKSKAVIWQIVRLTLSSALPRIKRVINYIKASSFALYSWLAFLLLSSIAWLGAVLLPSYNLRWKVVGLSARIVAKTTRIAIKTIGIKNIPDISNSCVFVVNHASYIDSLVIAAALPGPFNFVSKSEFSKHLITRLPLNNLHAQFVERFDISKSVDDTQQLLNTLKSGKQLLFFAEGTFTRIPGLGQFHLGAFKIAADAGVPIIPVSIRGSRSILREGSWFPRYGSLTVTIGKAIDPVKIAKKVEKQKSWDIAITLRKRARDFILRHCGEPDLT